MMYHELSDSELVSLAREGSKKAFEALVRRFTPGLVGFLHSLETPVSLVDDIVQETFTKAFFRLVQFDQSRRFSTWLFGIGKNAFFDHCRKNARERKMFDSLDISTFLLPPEKFEEQVEKQKTVEELLQLLPEKAKILIELRIFRDLPFAEIADLLDDTEGNVRIKFFRIIHQLRTLAGKGGKK